MLIIPTSAVPNQTLLAQLGGQTAEINVYQEAYGLFVDLYVAGTLIIGGVVAQNLNRIVRDAYLGFTGDLIFGDTQGTDDPVYWGLGTRWLLAYLGETDLTAAGFAA